ncbi:hypothetical protein B0J17DRAFT_723785 [Rhizoctonia solani]|nr:hypothetical protein B0J17DRAFT_723785 [Rhizoctonia solani]
MYFITLFTAVSTALLAANGVQAAGNFSASCSSYWIQSNNFLYVTCGDGRGGTTTSSLNLNACIGNDGANLLCRANGSYAVSCSDYLIRTGAYTVRVKPSHST